MLLSIGITQSLEFGVSPPELIFNVNKDSLDCKPLFFMTDSNRSYEILLYDKWDNSTKELKKRKLENYNSNINNIKLIYPKRVILEKEGQIDVCFEGKKEGVYKGVLIFDVKDSYAAIGVWIEAKVNENNDSQKLLKKIEGSIMKNGVILFLILSLFVYIFLLCFFLWISINKKRENLLYVNSV